METCLFVQVRLHIRFVCSSSWDYSRIHVFVVYLLSVPVEENVLRSELRGCVSPRWYRATSHLCISFTPADTELCACACVCVWPLLLLSGSGGTCREVVLS